MNAPFFAICPATTLAQDYYWRQRSTLAPPKIADLVPSSVEVRHADCPARGYVSINPLTGNTLIVMPKTVTQYYDFDLQRALLRAKSNADLAYARASCVAIPVAVISTMRSRSPLLAATALMASSYTIGVLFSRSQNQYAEHWLLRTLPRSEVRRVRDILQANLADHREAREHSLLARLKFTPEGNVRADWSTGDSLTQRVAAMTRALDESE